jgi:transposase
MAGPGDQDGKLTALAASRCVNPHPEKVTDARFTAGGFFDARDLVQVKYEAVRAVREDDLSVTEAAGAFGMSRPTYYAAAAALEAGGLAALVPARPGPKGAHKMTPEVMAFCQQLRQADPQVSAADLAGQVTGRFGVTVHPRTVERALARAAGTAAAGPADTPREGPKSR